MLKFPRAFAVHGARSREKASWPRKAIESFAIAVALAAPLAAHSQTSDDKTFLAAVSAAIEQANAAGNDAWVASILDVARSARPDLEQQIDALAVKNVEPVTTTEDVTQTIAKDSGPRPLSRASLLTWDGEFELAVDYERGEKQELEIDGSLDVTRTLNGRQLQLRLDYETTTTNRELIEDRIAARLDGRHPLTDRLDLASFVSAESDQFSGYEYRYQIGVGPSYQIFDREGLQWRVGVGPAFQISRTTLQPETVTDWGAGLESRLRWRPHRSFAIGADVTGLYADRSELFAKLFLEWAVTDRLGIRLSEELDTEFNPPEGIKSNNPKTQLSLVMRLGPLKEGAPLSGTKGPD
jgi:putative salt-induced outer membrane protein YdiY